MMWYAVGPRDAVGVASRRGKVRKIVGIVDSILMSRPIVRYPWILHRKSLDS
jgi:hypothetical protein